MFASEKVRGSSDRRIALLFDRGQCVAIDLVVTDNFVDDFRLAFQIAGGRDRRRLLGILAARGGSALWPNSSGFYPVDYGFRNCIRVFADFILEVGSVFVDLVGVNSAPIFQADDFRGSASLRRKTDPTKIER